MLVVGGGGEAGGTGGEGGDGGCQQGRLSATHPYFSRVSDKSS